MDTRQVKKMSELKRCPFCGGEAKIDCYLYFDEFNDWFIRCTSCFCRTRTFKTKKSAILTWNNRKPMERIVERLEEYEGTYVDVDIVRGIIKEEGDMNE